MWISAKLLMLLATGISWTLANPGEQVVSCAFQTYMNCRHYCWRNCAERGVDCRYQCGHGCGCKVAWVARNNGGCHQVKMCAFEETETEEQE